MSLGEATEQREKKERFSLKNIGRTQWLTILLLGLLLAVIALPAGKDKTAPQTGASLLGEEASSDEISSGLEQQLKQLLEQVEGVGKVQVMIYAEDSGGGLSLTGEDPGKIRGALIVAEGADNPLTVQKIQEAVMALFQVDAHKIRVMKMK